MPFTANAVDVTTAVNYGVELYLHVQLRLHVQTNIERAFIHNLKSTCAGVSIAVTCVSLVILSVRFSNYLSAYFQHEQNASQL
jgi:hypothetical protein